MKSKECLKYLKKNRHSKEKVGKNCSFCVPSNLANLGSKVLEILSKNIPENFKSVKTNMASITLSHIPTQTFKGNLS